MSGARRAGSRPAPGDGSREAAHLAGPFERSNGLI